MKHRYILIADVGNTSTHVALCRDRRILKELRFSTNALRSSGPALSRFLGKHAVAVAAIASVVPARARDLERVIFKRAGIQPSLIGRDIAVPVGNRARQPKQVGVDRLLNALAAHRLLGRAAIVVDFGTTITFDVVSRKGEYLGGVIAPGIEITLDALYERTALLPKIKLEHPKARIGRDTVECIRIGSSVGIGGLCDRIIEEIGRALPAKPAVLATGGYASFMKRYSRHIRRIEPWLTLQGILFSL